MMQCDNLGNDKLFTLNGTFGNTLIFPLSSQIMLDDFNAAYNMANAILGNTLVNGISGGSSAGYTATDVTMRNRVYNITGSPLCYMNWTNGVGSNIILTQKKENIYTHLPSTFKDYRLKYNELVITWDDNLVQTLLPLTSLNVLVSTKHNINNQCNSVLTQDLIVDTQNPIPNNSSFIPSESYSITDNPCVNTTLTAVLSNPNNPIYQWHFGANCNNAINSETNSTYTSNVQGTYSVKVINGVCEYCENQII